MGGGRGRGEGGGGRGEYRIGSLCRLLSVTFQVTSSLEQLGQSKPSLHSSQGKMETIFFL